MESDFTYRSQHVDYLGFLEAQLRDLQGIDRLAYELIQNADDVQVARGDAVGDAPPTRLSFDVADEALIVENDAAFRAVDFRRLQRLAGGGKRDEPDTTGAFGLGFIAVYQVTDAPQIFSNNLHWTIRPDAPPERRILEQPAQTSGTRFVLPWALDEASPVRRALRIAAIDPLQLDAIARELAAAIAPASLFLKQLRVLEVRRNGVLVRRQQRRLERQRLVVAEADGREAAFLFLHGDFSAAARRLRQEYDWQIEEKRHSDVTVAIPLADLPDQGRLFAVLPTDTTMPLPVLVNADFFPTTDRRRIHFEDGYQARWNEHALSCAALVLADSLVPLAQTLTPNNFFQLLEHALQTAQTAERRQLPTSFTAFWQALAPRLSQASIVFTAGGDWRIPAAARIVQSRAAHPVLQALGVEPVHAALAPHYPLLRRPEIGVSDLSLDDLRQALQQSSLTSGEPLALAPAPLNTFEAWRSLWQLVDERLAPLPRHQQREQALRHLGDAPIVVDHNMALRSLRHVYRGDAETRALFPDVHWLHHMLQDETFPGRLAPRFGVRQAVEYLAQLTQEQVQEVWQMGRLDLPRLFRWFEAHQIEIFADDPTLQREIRNLPLAPISGELRPLAHLYIPGGFEDPLKLAAVVDVESLGGRRQFLQDLGLQQLDFDTYIHTHIPRILAQNPDLPSDARHRLVQLLAQRLGHFRDDADLRRQLSRLPLVPCMDGSFRPARDVYASRAAAALLGPRAHIAEPRSQAVEALYRWLGVRREPSPSDLIQLVLDLSTRQSDSREPLGDDALAVLLHCWQHLDDFYRQEALAPDLLARLRAQPALPNRNRILSRPTHLLYVDQPAEIAQFDSFTGALEEYLLHDDVPHTALVAAAGVRPISAAMQYEVVDDRRAAPAPEIERRIRQRRPLIARLLDAAQTAGSAHDSLRAVRNLRVLQIPALRLRARLQLGPDTFATAPEHRSAAYVAHANALFVDAHEPSPPWVAIARELAALISPTAPAAGLALGIREVLSAAAYDQAAAILDELGYP